ncbi:hypothetical protein ACRE1S_01235 [Helicobacter himalayensis]|uniref:hypothetical protein n=1 Tax=Helicobacter himalayensis TaxID=1591088 RepID=UPI003D6E95D1
MQITSLNNSFTNPLTQKRESNAKESNLEGQDSLNLTKNPQNPQNLDAQNTTQNISQNVQVDSTKEADSTQKDKVQYEFKEARITYGLQILERMSDEEYRAFLRASEGLSEDEKMIMAQSLYRFTDFYQGRKEIDSAHRALQDKYKAFGVDNEKVEQQITRYKNALTQIQREAYGNGI